MRTQQVGHGELFFVAAFLFGAVVWTGSGFAFVDDCVKCHGETCMGDVEKFYPRINGQHYKYMLRQFEWIRDGKRRNANPEMVEQIERFTARDISAVMAYTASLRPPVDKTAEPGWRNPDFPNHWRGTGSKPGICRFLIPGGVRLR